MVAEHLRSHPGLRNHPIISIFISQDVPDRDTHFIEDFLEIIIKQLAHGKPVDDEASLAYEKFIYYREDVLDGTRRRLRLKVLREALYLRLETLSQSRSFLVLDGIDRCDATLRWMIEEELSCLQTAGLSILLTSRIGVFEENHMKGRCDDHRVAPEDDPIPVEEQEPLRLWQVCNCQQPDETFVLCLACSKAGRGCLYW